MTPDTIGCSGAGRIGTQVAREVIKAGHPMVIRNSRRPQTLTDLVQELSPQARAATEASAAPEGELVMVAVLLSGIDQLAVEPLAGKRVRAAAPFSFTHHFQEPSLCTTLP